MIVHYSHWPQGRSIMFDRWTWFRWTHSALPYPNNMAEYYPEFVRCEWIVPGTVDC
jgi:hypothetical protein